MSLLWYEVYGSLATDIQVCKLRGLALQSTSLAWALRATWGTRLPMQEVYQLDDPRLKAMPEPPAHPENHIADLFGLEQKDVGLWLGVDKLWGGR